MKENGNPQEWTPEHEQSIRYHLQEIYLKFNFIRPRIIAARKAIMQVICELIDSGKIAPARIQYVFRTHDDAVPHFKTASKPSFIQTLQEREFGGVKENWIYNIAASKRLEEELLDYGQNMKVIGELSLIKNLDWGSPSEEYMCQITTHEIPDPEADYIFGSVFQRLSHEYHTMENTGPSLIVIRDHMYNQFELKSKWIALNPVLARYLKWIPDPTNLFAWQNTKGELMAASIYWSNGNIEMAPRQDGEVGEGWFVVASQKGLEQIKQVEPKLFIQKRLKRSKDGDEKVVSKTTRSSIEL